MEFHSRWSSGQAGGIVFLFPIKIYSNPLKIINSEIFKKIGKKLIIMI